jgi:hypothetical protein
MSCFRGGGWSAKNWMQLVLMQLVSREGVRVAGMPMMRQSSGSETPKAFSD